MRPPCGTTGGYDAHLWRGEETCPACRAARSEHQRAYRARTVENFAHGASGYTNHSCRCNTCRAGWSDLCAKMCVQRKAARQLVGGRLVAVNATKHGSAVTYRNHGCQCEPCLAAASVAEKKARVRRAQARQAKAT